MSVLIGDSRADAGEHGKRRDDKPLSHIPTPNAED